MAAGYRKITLAQARRKRSGVFVRASSGLMREVLEFAPDGSWAYLTTGAIHSAGAVFYAQAPKRPRSPHRKLDILEVRFVDDPFKVLVVCVLLNRTRKEQVEGVVDVLFRAYPDARALARARLPRLAAILRPLGLQNVRARRLVRFARDVLAFGIEENTVGQLHGVGQYGVDAFMALYHGRSSIPSKDHALRNYVRYRSEPFRDCPRCRAPFGAAPSSCPCGWVEHDHYKILRHKHPRRKK
jgi:endonuclease III